MNWSKRIYEGMQLDPQKMALWTPKTGSVCFEELAVLSRKYQKFLRQRGLQRGDAVLLLDLPGPRLYAAITAIVGLGAYVLFVEPWMSVRRINTVIALTRPKIFWSPLLGQMWALRIPALRQIPQWIRPKEADQERDPKDFIVEDMRPEDRAILSFTSGTSGEPKGIPRTHHFLSTVDDIFRQYDLELELKPDMAIFPNVVLYQLGRGRGTILVPPAWKHKDLLKIAGLPDHLQPHTLSCGPAFLDKLIAVEGFPHLRWIGVGGALIDRSLLERAFTRFPQAAFSMIYGSTEIEPVASVDARVALQKSMERGYFQVLNVGHPIPEVEMQNTPEGLWVHGPHATMEYLVAGAEDLRLKRRDAAGKGWHFMGDRIELDDAGLWYAGRSFQKPEDFKMEQAIYAHLQRSNCFIVRNAADQPVLIGENIQKMRVSLLQNFPALEDVYEGKIFRDKRHRARIDRNRSQQALRKKLKSVNKALNKA